jgi:hypothetical protein
MNINIGSAQIVDFTLEIIILANFGDKKEKKIKATNSLYQNKEMLQKCSEENKKKKEKIRCKNLKKKRDCL